MRRASFLKQAPLPRDRGRNRRGGSAATALRPCGHLRREAAARKGGGPGWIPLPDTVMTLSTASILRAHRDLEKSLSEKNAAYFPIMVSGGRTEGIGPETDKGTKPRRIFRWGRFFLWLAEMREDRGRTDRTTRLARIAD